MWRPSLEEAVWVPAGSGWRPGIVHRLPPSGTVYCRTWAQRGKVPASTKPPRVTQTSRREPWELKPRDEGGERPAGDRNTTPKA